MVFLYFNLASDMIDTHTRDLNKRAIVLKEWLDTYGLPNTLRSLVLALAAKSAITKNAEEEKAYTDSIASITHLIYFIQNKYK